LKQSLEFIPAGVIPAVLLPFEEDYSIDEAAYRRHLNFVAATKGISALVTNAHSSEAASCSFDEQKRVLDITMEEVGAKLPVVNGIYADGSLEAARLAAMAQAGGASALLVFPPNPFIMGGQLRPEMAVAHFSTIAQVSDLPMIVFQYPIMGGQGYPLDTLLRMAEEVPSIRAIKDWCNDPMLHQRQVKVLQSLDRPVNVLTTHSAWLFSSLVSGCAGLLSGSGSVIADLQAALFEAVQNDQLTKARELARRIQITAEVFYAPPAVDMHNRMKEALVLLGRLERSVVRPPLVKPEPDEIARIGAAMKEAGITTQGAIMN
jgi:4-hydroxy-tetrahydrodipicolinate synthase